MMKEATVPLGTTLVILSVQSRGQYLPLTHTVLYTITLSLYLPPVVHGTIFSLCQNSSGGRGLLLSLWIKES